MESRLCRYTLYLDNRGCSLERTRQTTADAFLKDMRAFVAMQAC